MPQHHHIDVSWVVIVHRGPQSRRNGKPLVAERSISSFVQGGVCSHVQSNRLFRCLDGIMAIIAPKPILKRRTFSYISAITQMSKCSLYKPTKVVRTNLPPIWLLLFFFIFGAWGVFLLRPPHETARTIQCRKLRIPPMFIALHKLL